jgi:hypothetical protein
MFKRLVLSRERKVNGIVRFCSLNKRQGFGLVRDSGLGLFCSVWVGLRIVVRVGLGSSQP